jgi:hypothetical protein
VGAKSLAAVFPAANKASITRWQGSRLPKAAEDGSGDINYYPVLHPSYIARGRWFELPLLAGVFGGATTYTKPFVVPRLVSKLTGPLTTLAADIENNADGSIDIVGISNDGQCVVQVSVREAAEYLTSPDLTTLFVHFAKHDIQHLEREGVRLDRAKVFDTMILQAQYQSEMEVGLDDSLAITLAGQQTYHKSLYGNWDRSRQKDREFCRAIWRQILGYDPKTEAEWYRVYNMLDTAMTWRLGMKLREMLSR